jgi:S-adenosylmethionine decarboxylase
MLKPDLGEQWVVDAFGCDPGCLRDEPGLRSLVARLINDLSLHPLDQGYWHRFGGSGGVTGLVPLSESHVALHTYPECGVATFDLYCCRSGCIWPWDGQLRQWLGARSVAVRRLSRGEASEYGGRDAVEQRQE